MLGGILFGHVADHVGRLPVMLGTLYTSVAVGVGLAFVPTYPIFAVLRFVQGVLMQVSRPRCPAKCFTCVGRLWACVGRRYCAMCALSVEVLQGIRY